MKVASIIALSNKLTRCAMRVEQKGFTLNEQHTLMAWVCLADKKIDKIAEGHFKKYMKRQIERILDQLYRGEYGLG